jgi:glycosyltransferase involved in cell wall biosynthesis
MRIFLALGPGDIVGDHRKNAIAPTGDGSQRGETSITFSNQVIRLMRARGHEALAVSSNPRVDRFAEEAMETQNAPKPLAGKAGGLYHLSQLLYAIRLAWTARRFRAELAIVDSGTSHWFMLAAFTVLRIPVAVNFHNVRWPHGHEPQGALGRLMRRFDSWFLRRHAVGAMGCSPECGIQARADGAEALPYFPWTSQYREAGFEPDQRPLDDGVFRVAFVGRVEQSKGVFDIVGMAQQLRANGGRAVQFEICGDGGALLPLRHVVSEAGVGEAVTVRGRLERDDLLAVYARSHAVIVPTRATFCEGMPLVCAEAMLAGRPVITSILSNALPVIGPAVEEAQPEVLSSYVAAIERLGADPEQWCLRQSATIACRAQFLDRSLSYAASMDRLIVHVSGRPAQLLDYRLLFGD